MRLRRRMKLDMRAQKYDERAYTNVTYARKNMISARVYIECICARKVVGYVHAQKYDERAQKHDGRARINMMYLRAPKYDGRARVTMMYLRAPKYDGRAYKHDVCARAKIW